MVNVHVLDYFYYGVLDWRRTVVPSRPFLNILKIRDYRKNYGVSEAIYIYTGAIVRPLFGKGVTDLLLLSEAIYGAIVRPPFGKGVTDQLLLYIYCSCY